jgi:hypothetical protein
MLKLVRLIVLVLAIPAFFACMFESIVCLDRSADYTPLLWFVAGYIGFAAVYAFLLRGRLAFLEHFMHEFAHMVTAWLSFGRVSEFLARGRPDERGEAGHVSIRWPNVVNVLAPYYLPTLAIPLVAIRLFVMHYLIVKWINPIIGAAMAFHHLQSIHQFGENLQYMRSSQEGDDPAPLESDVQRMGCVFSVLFVTMVNLLVLLLVLNVVLGNGPALWLHVVSAGERALVLYRLLLARVGIV